jgi:hypothetical protein
MPRLAPTLSSRIAQSPGRWEPSSVNGAATARETHFIVINDDRLWTYCLGRYE